MFRAAFEDENKDCIAWIIPVNEDTVVVSVTHENVEKMTEALSANNSLFSVVNYHYANYICNWTIRLSSKDKDTLVELVEEVTSTTGIVEGEEEDSND